MIDAILDRDRRGYFGWAAEFTDSGGIGREIITARHGKKRTALDSLREMANRMGWRLPEVADRTGVAGA